MIFLIFSWNYHEIFHPGKWFQNCFFETKFNKMHICKEIQHVDVKK